MANQESGDIPGPLFDQETLERVKQKLRRIDVGFSDEAVSDAPPPGWPDEDMFQ